MQRKQRRLSGRQRTRIVGESGTDSGTDGGLVEKVGLRGWQSSPMRGPRWR